MKKKISNFLQLIHCPEAWLYVSGTSFIILASLKEAWPIKRVSSISYRWDTKSIPTTTFTPLQDIVLCLLILSLIFNNCLILSFNNFRITLVLRFLWMIWFIVSKALKKKLLIFVRMIKFHSRTCNLHNNLHREKTNIWPKIMMNWDK